MFKYILLSSLFLLGFSACSDSNRESKRSASSGMKCGAGKCGANMFDGKSALVKKKKNILKQMREDDPRKECVLKAKTTKAVYNCVRSPKNNKLTLKCGAGKCGTTKEHKKMSTMKCGAGKCGSGIK